MINVHRHLGITDEQRDRFVALYLEAIDEADLPRDERGASASGSRVAEQAGDVTCDHNLPRRPARGPW